MKKVLLFIVLLVPFMVYAEGTCDSTSVKIESIELKDITKYSSELDDPSTDNNSVNVGVQLNRVGDNARYELVLKNTSDEDYEINENTLNVDSDFISYSIELEDGSNVIKAGTSKKVYLVVKYDNRVPDNQYNAEGIFNDTKNVVVDLTNKETFVEQTIKAIEENPVTSTGIMLVIVAVVSGVVVLCIKKTKVRKYMVLLIPVVLLIPCYVSAICKCEIKINSNVLIEKSFSGTIYRTNSELVFDNELLVPHDVELWYGSIEYGNEGYHYNFHDRIYYYLTEKDCLKDIKAEFDREGYDEEDGDRYFCEARTMQIGTDTYVSDSLESNEIFYLKHVVVDGMVTKTYVCHYRANKETCISNNHDENVNIMRDAYGENNCNEQTSDIDEDTRGYYCKYRVNATGGEDSIYSYNNGDFAGWYCGINCYSVNGMSWCELGNCPV